MDKKNIPASFHSGFCFDAYRFLGAHPAQQDKESGWVFRLWAPGAREVWLEGDFSGWQGIAMQGSQAGVWSVFVPAAQTGQLYKYSILGADGRWQMHSDPYAFSTELRPGTASRLTELAFAFDDDEWMARRSKGHDAPVNIYELHTGSWRRSVHGEWLNYEQLAQQLIPWLRQNHFTHVELLPLAEHPFDGSWGYQLTGYFSVTSRYGTPQQFAAFVNACHKAGIGVLMDFVPVHFAVNEDGLARLDGSALYEYDSDVGTSEWGSYNFNPYRGEVASFLCSAAALWLDVYHCDGLRMDAVSRALYWQGEPARGLNEGAVALLRRMNSGLHERFPTAMLVAEDSTNYPKVTAPVEYDGLGFDYKWDMGWMHDTLDYFATPFDRRSAAYHKLTFGMEYFYRELYILPFSHDENVHGKKTIIDKLWGSYEQKCAQCRLLYFWMFTQPGKKLNFMGGELAHFREWDESRQLDWDLLEYPFHADFVLYWAALARLYCTEEALHSGEYNPDCFAWVVQNDPQGGVYAWLRRVPGGHTLLAIINTKPHSYGEYILPLGFDCHAELLMNTEWRTWGGAQPFSDGALATQGGRLPLRLPALGGLLVALEG